MKEQPIVFNKQEFSLNLAPAGIWNYPQLSWILFS